MRSTALLVGFMVYLIQSCFADEMLYRGTVINNNMEDLDVGAYLHIVETGTKTDVFVIYKPYQRGKELLCANPWHATMIGVGDQIEVRGTLVHEINGVHTENRIIETCAEGSYIHITSRK